MSADSRKRWRAIIRLVHAEGLTRGAEVGVKSGRFFDEVLSACPDVTMIAVDLWAPSAAYAHWPDDHHTINYDRAKRAAKKHGNRIRLIRAESVETAATVEPGSLDFVFIDADHSYLGCRCDIEAWRPALRPGGWMTGHDYGHPDFPGVQRAVDEAFPQGVKTDVDHTWLVQV